MFSFFGVQVEIFTEMDKEQVALLAGVTICVLSIGAFIFWGPNPRPKRRGKPENLFHSLLLFSVCK